MRRTGSGCTVSPVLRSLRPPPRDAALAAALLLVGLVEALVVDTERPTVVHALGTAVVMGALAWRRRVPLAVLAIVLLGLVALGDPEGQFVIFAALVIASYTTGSALDGKRALIGLVIAVGPLWLAMLAERAEPADFVAVGVLYGGAWGVGRLVRKRDRRANELEQRAIGLESEHAERRAAAVAEERARIARELHDIVSHSISVVAVQTQAVRRRLSPEQQREADDLRAVETTARQAMVEMRHLFGVLRSNGERPSLAPQPGLDQLERLLADTRAAGLPVELRVVGDRVLLPPGVDLAAYRIVQEALTNTRKHAGPAHAEVTLRFRDGELELLIEDDGRYGNSPPDRGGHGLVGMSERVALYGGTFEAGSRPDGGFAVRATLPLRNEARLG
jgi:signal transduction histidine kinase